MIIKDNNYFSIILKIKDYDDVCKCMLININFLEK